MYGNLQPAYSSVKAPGKKQLRKWWGKIFRKYKVDAVFNADAHSYKRFNIGGIPYVITAGGGASLYEVEEKQPQSKALDIKHLHYIKVDIEDDKATFRVKKTHRVRDDALTETEGEPAAGLLDKFVIEAD